MYLSYVTSVNRDIVGFCFAFVSTPFNNNIRYENSNNSGNNSVLNYNNNVETTAQTTKTTSSAQDNGSTV